LWLCPSTRKSGFTIDKAEIKARFLKLQRALHPDKFTLKSLEEQEYSAQASSQVNEGFKTLTDSLSRALYLVKTPPFSSKGIVDLSFFFFWGWQW